MAKKTTVSQQKLTPKQQRFCDEYLVDLNAAAAAARAGYSKKSARFIGHENLTKPYIAVYIWEHIKDRAARTEAKADDVVRELARIAFSNIGDFLDFDDKGVQLKSSAEMTREQLGVIASVRERITDAGSVVEFRMRDKIRALELLGRHLGIFEEEEEDERPVSIKITVQKATTSLSARDHDKTTASSAEAAGL